MSGYIAALTRKSWIEDLTSVKRGIRLLREGAPILNVAHPGALTDEELVLRMTRKWMAHRGNGER